MLSERRADFLGFGVEAEGGVQERLDMTNQWRKGRKKDGMRKSGASDERLEGAEVWVMDQRRMKNNKRGQASKVRTDTYSARLSS